MDEPLTNLDAKLREVLRVELVELRRELKTPMVFVTARSGRGAVDGRSDRRAVRGRILQTGAPRRSTSGRRHRWWRCSSGSPRSTSCPGPPRGRTVARGRRDAVMRAEASGADRAPARRAPRERGPAGRRGRLGSGGARRRAHRADDHACWSTGSGRASTSWSRAARRAPGQSRAPAHRCRARRSFRADARRRSKEAP